MRPLALSTALVFVACGGSLAPSASSAEVEHACERTLANLRADKAMGFSCEAAKARAAKAEPLCPVSFSCPDAATPNLDGGVQ